MNQPSPQDLKQNGLPFLSENRAIDKQVPSLDLAELSPARHFQEIFDALPVAIYVTDAEGKLVSFNSAAVEFSGRVPELGVDTWCVTWKLYYLDGTPMPHEACPMAIALKEGRVVRGVEAIAERPDGTRVWFEPYPTLLRDSTGRIIGGINMLIDITERKQAEQASAMLASIVQSSGDAIVSKTLDSVITSWNTAAERMFGYTAEEAIGQSILMIIPPELQHEEQEILARLRRGERVSHYDTVRMTRDGRRIDISLNISPIRDASGRIIGASKIARDITERKQAEEALSQLNETLESRVQERTEQVRQLVNQLTMSEQEERRRISAILHDDLQQRLYGLNFQIAMLRGMLSKEKEGDKLQFIDKIHEALSASIQLVRSLSVDLSPPVLHDEGLFEALRWLAVQMEEQQRFTVTVVAQETLPPLDDDMRVLLFQFTRELLFNVVKHAAVSTAVVKLAYKDNHLRVEVSDQGQGFDTDIKTPRTSQGLVRIIQRLQLIRGHMHIDSRPGEGTRVDPLCSIAPKE